MVKRLMVVTLALLVGVLSPAISQPGQIDLENQVKNILPPANGGSAARQRTIYVAKHGDDTNSGDRPELPMLTIGAAITAAEGLTPTPDEDNPAVVWVVDSGIYAEDLIVLEQGMYVHAPGAQIQKITFTDDLQGGEFYAIEPSLGTDNAVQFASDITAGKSAFCKVNGYIRLSAAGTGRGVLINVGGTGIVDITSIFLDADSKAGIEVDSSGSHLVGRVGQIIETGTRSGTIGIFSDVGTAELIVGRITADTAWDSGATFGDMRLICSSLSGTENPTGGAGFVFTPGGTVAAGDGSAAAPAFTFYEDDDTGLYRFSNDQMSVATGGSERVRLENARVKILGGIDLLLYDNTTSQYCSIQVPTDVTASYGYRFPATGPSGADSRLLSGATGINVWQRNNYSAAGAPAATDDVDGGYLVGSVWVDTSADDAYICVDNSDDAAVWDKITP